jgi:hypothetical protein
MMVKSRQVLYPFLTLWSQLETEVITEEQTLEREQNEHDVLGVVQECRREWLSR